MVERLRLCARVANRRADTGQSGQKHPIVAATHRKGNVASPTSASPRAVNETLFWFFFWFFFWAVCPNQHNSTQLFGIVNRGDCDGELVCAQSSHRG